MAQNKLFLKISIHFWLETLGNFIVENFTVVITFRVIDLYTLAKAIIVARSFIVYLKFEVVVSIIKFVVMPSIVLVATFSITIKVAADSEYLHLKTKCYRDFG